MEQAQIETVGSVVVDNKFPKITLNKDGTPRKPWTAKNPRKKVARQTYNEIHVSLSDEVYAFIESYCGRKKVGHLVRKLLAEFMMAQKALTLPQTPPTKEERCTYSYCSCLFINPRGKFKGQANKVEMVNCESCEQSFEKTREWAKFCSDKCRQAAHRAKSK
jgi:hypothetical protein